MKPGALRPFFLLIIFSSCAVLHTAAQNLSGIWRGYFISDDNQQYKFEIQIGQSGKNGITGVSYSYLTTVFYGKATLTGHVNPAAKTVLIQEIKTVEVRMAQSSVACIMKFLLNYTKSGNEEFLEGNYTSKYEKASKFLDIKQGEGCGGGTIFLRKVPTSDFYVEPFLRDKPTVRTPAPKPSKPASKIPAKPQTNTKPVAKTTAKPPLKTPASTGTKAPVQKPVVVQKPKTDTLKRNTAPVAKQEVKKPSPPPMTIPANTRSRKNDLLQTINVKNQEISIRLYDNGEVDNDTISVYLDNQLVLSHKRLSASPINLSLKLDENNPEHILILVAENLGRIPPNTSLMIVYDGDKRYQVMITSTEQKNALVRFRYESSGN